jgi:O-antigen ligase
MLRDHLLLGVGLDQFLYHYPRYLHEVAAREPNLSHPHNIVLDFWLRLGVLGVLALVFAAYQFWLRVAPASPAVPGRRRAAGTTGEAGPDIVLATGVLAAGIGLLIHGLVDNSYFVLDLAYATWIVLLLSELAHQPDAASQIERV